MYGQGAHWARAGQVVFIDAPYRLTCSDKGKLSLYAALQLGDDHSTMATLPVQAAWSKITRAPVSQAAGLRRDAVLCAAQSGSEGLLSCVACEHQPHLCGPCTDLTVHEIVV